MAADRGDAPAAAEIVGRLVPRDGVKPTPKTARRTPREFAELKIEALKMGFRHVESGPLVRSSYHAHEQADSTRSLSTLNK